MKNCFLDKHVYIQYGHPRTQISTSFSLSNMSMTTVNNKSNLSKNLDMISMKKRNSSSNTRKSKRKKLRNSEHQNYK